MNTHIFKHIANENNIDVAHSIEMFATMVIAITFVGLVFFAAL